MKAEWRRFAPAGLYLALVAAIAAAGLYIVQREWNLFLQISLGLVVLGVAIYALLDPEKVRQARYGSNALVMSIAFLGILVVINYLVYQNNQRWDLTENQKFTLAPETISTLKSLPEKVTAKAFFSKRISSETAKNLLDQYSFQSDKFSYQFIDPEADPVAAQDAGITRDGSIVLYMGDHKEMVSSTTEQDITSALVKLINPQQSTVYFLTGHGEYSPDDTGDKSYSTLKSTLENKNYTVKTLSLITTNKVPDDAKLIVIAGPKKPISQGEVDLLKKYADGGGSLIVMEEPLPVTQFGDAADPLADYLSKDWGITLGKDIVVDQTSSQPFAPYAAQYGDHPITQKMQRITSVYPTARSVTATGSVQGVTTVNLVMTAQQSWAETDLANLTNQNSQIQFDQGKDVAGPVSLAVSGENLKTKGRVVVFGDADFAANANIGAYANSDILVNSVDWAAQQENLINLTPKATVNRFMLPPQRFTMNLILLGAVFILPGLFLFAGIMAFVERRRRG
jgi:ABC-type uncharacterized transport system involved in gliding motility auxiliary subunit